MNKMFLLKQRPCNRREFITENMSEQAQYLLKFYKRQGNYFSCAIASLVPIINSIHLRTVTNEKKILKSKTLRSYQDRFSERGDNGIWGVSLLELSSLSQSILQEYGIQAQVSPIFFRKLSLKKAKKLLSELSSDTFIIANFLSNFGIGHFSPVAGYDHHLDLILIADTFHPEPYFVSLQSFVSGCSTKDGNSFRGVLKIKLII